MIIISIRDNVTELFHNLVLSNNEADAIRSFYALKDEPNYKDFTLWKMGDYDMHTGEIKPERKRLAEAAV